MNRVLVASSYFYRLDPKQWRDGRPYPPLGTLQTAAVLREAGHTVEVYDAGMASGPATLSAHLDTFRPDILVIQEDGFNYLTKMCLTVMRDAALAMITEAVRRNISVAVSGSDPTDHPEPYLEAGADAVVLGESEAVLRDLVERLGQEQAWTDLPGVAFLSAGRLARNTPPPVMRDLDALPLPAWDLADVAPYRARWRSTQGRFSLNMATTRGCPFKCNWCAKPIYGNRYNSRSPEHVVRELEMLMALHAPDHIWFADDIFGLKPGWVQRFRDALEARGLKIRYKVQSRVDLLLESDTIDALVDSGLEEVWVGAESGSQRILDAMDKGTTVEQVREATRLLRSKGVRVCFFLRFGYLGETPEDVAATVRMVEELMPDDIGISVSYPLPGTLFHEKVKQDLKEKANWTDSDDLAMMFRSRHHPAYYKELHRYVHRRYRRRQALRGEGRMTGVRRLLALMYYAPAAAVGAWRLGRLEKA